MISDKAVRWLQVLSNVGIVLGLVLVALQMNQASNFNQSQLEAQHNVYKENQQIALGENFAATQAKLAIGDAAEITDEDLMLYHFYVNTYISDMVRIREFEKQGYVEEGAWKWMATSRVICGIFDGDVGSAYLDIMDYQDDLGMLIRSTVRDCRQNMKDTGKGNSFWSYYLKSMRVALSSKHDEE